MANFRASKVQCRRLQQTIKVVMVYEDGKGWTTNKLLNNQIRINFKDLARKTKTKIKSIHKTFAMRPQSVKSLYSTS